MKARGSRFRLLPSRTGARAVSALHSRKERVRHLTIGRTEALGIPAGPERRELVSGRPVTLASGRVVHPEEVLGEPQKGAKLCFVGDVARTGPLHKVVAGADLLAIEATYLEKERELAKGHGHITALAAARLAQKAGVKKLVLHHISRRYHAQAVLEEAQAVSPGDCGRRRFRPVSGAQRKTNREESRAKICGSLNLERGAIRPSVGRQ